MNCPTKDTNQSSVPGYNQNPSTLDNDLVTKNTFNSSPNFNTLDQERWADGLGQFKEIDDNNSAENVKNGSGSQGGPISITKLTSLQHPGMKSNFDTDTNSNTNNNTNTNTNTNITNTHSQNPMMNSATTGERTPLFSLENTEIGGFANNTNSPNEPLNSSIYHRNSQDSISNNSDDYANIHSNHHQGSQASLTGRFRSFFRSNDFTRIPSTFGGSAPGGNSPPTSTDSKSQLKKIYRIFVKYLKFVGPGILLSSSFCDPGNYITGTAAGAMYEYKLLFAILLSNFFAVFLQILCTKLGCVTGLDLAQNCRQHLPHWLNITVYIMAEIAIIATDLAEVVGTAIALNILFHIPLSAGVILTIVDVLVVLMAYKPNGEMKIVRYFEYLVSALVMIVVVCFAIELGSIAPSNTADIFRGFLPSKELFETQGLYLFCGILGATVMPHSLYLGSGIVQPRLRDYDQKHGYFASPKPGNDEVDEIAMLKYRPSIHAINCSLKYTIVELVVSLFTVALFVNSAILIVAGATLANTPEAADADLYSIYDMLHTLLSPLAGTVFALALLFSGQSSGVVCTLAGQIVSEGFLHWSFQPWVRRLITRSLSVFPCFIATLFVGRKGLAMVLTASQVVLSLLLPFVSAPLLYFTAKKSIMSVSMNPTRVTPPSYNARNASDNDSEFSDGEELVDNADLLATAIAAHSVDRYSSQPFGNGGNDYSPYRNSLESSNNNESGLSPTNTLTDSAGIDIDHLQIGETDNEEDDLIMSSGRINEQDDDYDYDDQSLAASSIVVQEFKDMSNSRLTNIIAFSIFILTTGINLFLIISAALGADVHL